jgi:hypothetical protein
MFSLGCFEILILLGIVIIIARLARLERRESRWFRDKFLLFLRRARRLSGVKLILASLLVGLLFVLVLTALIGTRTPKTHGLIAILVYSLLWTAILLFIWGLVRLIFRDARWADCPPIDRLKDFLAERLSSDERVRLSAHLEACTACQHRVEGLTAGHHSWPGMAHKLSERPSAPEPALRKVMEKLMENDKEVTGDEPVFTADLPLGFLSPTDKPGHLGRLERYEVLEEIGRGGMGVVLKAFDPSLHRVVAIKVLAPQLATSGVARKRFLREAKAAAAVTHDHIVTIHAVDEANGLPYLVMHFVAGMSLQDRIDKEGPLELAEILRIGMQTASGLAAAHGHGIVHRDIKPANILLEDGVQRVKITDFGLARAMDDASLTQSGFVAGSPLYMAPEQARGEALDHRADLFSLGSVLYTMCTGRPPFRAANTLAVLRRVSEDLPRPIRETNPEVPDWLVAVVDKLMAKDPAERYQSAAEVMEVLGQHLAQLQDAKWVPPPAVANAPPAGLPTSVTICPSCGASLHVPECMVGTLVHCAECGKPFHVEDTSEVMQVARPVQWPLKPHRPRGRVHGKLPGCVLIAGACVGFLFLLILLYAMLRSDQAPMATPESLATTQRAPMPPQPRDPWGDLHGLPSGATLFGTFDLTPFGSLTFGDAQTQTLLRLFIPREEAERLTPENLGRINFGSIALGYYEKSKTADAHAIVRLSGTALDGHKRIVEFLRRNAGEKIEVEEQDRNLAGNGPVYVSGPDLPFALKIIDDHWAYLAVSLNKNAKASQHRKMLNNLSGTPIPNGYNPPWIKTAVINIPRDACGFLLGEIPAEWREVLCESLKLRSCPRTFILHMKREGDGVGLSLTLNLDKPLMGGALRTDIETWRPHALSDLQGKFPALQEEQRALAQLRLVLNKMSCVPNDSGGVRIQTHISALEWKAMCTLLKRAFPPDGND